VDAVYQNLEISKQSRNTLSKFGLTEGRYFLTTVHRAENTDKKERILSILDGFRDLYKEFGIPVIFPAHPRTVKMIKEFGLEIPEGTKVIDPVGYLDFLQLEGGAKLILTDSGGLQEEGCILGVPCVTLRDNTERPETVDVGANTVAGFNDYIMEHVTKMISTGRTWKNPYGKGNAAELTLKELPMQ
jgi:UDP-N-acetylglucosamine 2-epimerase (non-hydrolysing)